MLPMALTVVLSETRTLSTLIKYFSTSFFIKREEKLPGVASISV